MASISILTATFNSAAVIDGLIASLEAQSDADFEWVVVDGGSSDDTLARVDAAKVTRKIVLTGPDFGVYDALNKGLRAASGEFYLVVGSDDTLAPEAVANYRAAAAATPAPDLVTAGVRSGEVLCRPLGGRSWLYGMQAFISAHSVGVLMRRSLHERAGAYSRKFPIGADQLFIKRAVQSGARVVVADFCAGTFGSGGLSSVDTVGTLTEFFRVQLATERSKALQVLVFLLRLAKNYRRL